MQQAVVGDRVSAHVVVRLADGSTFLDTRAAAEPLCFVAGGDEVLPGISTAVVGMEPGESRLLALQPEEAFGQRDEELVARVPRAAAGPELAAGDSLVASRDGSEMTVWVKAVEGDDVVLDGNHPLAGCTLVVEIELLSCAPA